MLYLRGNSRWYHCIGGLAGLRAGVDTMEKRKILFLPGIEPWPSSPYPVAIPTGHSGFLPIMQKYKIQISMSFYKQIFVMKMMAADDRDVTVGRSIYWQNSYYLQPTRPQLNRGTVLPHHAASLRPHCSEI
jgi:hypothetical protein